MVARAYTVAFEGIEARLVEVQCAISPGIPAFSMVCYIEKPLLISSWFKITKADIGESRSEGLERAHFTNFLQCSECLEPRDCRMTTKLTSRRRLRQIA